MIYRPPNILITNFYKCLQTIHVQLQKENKYICLLGDFNVDTYSHNTTP